MHAILKNSVIFKNRLTKQKTYVIIHPKDKIRGTFNDF